MKYNVELTGKICQSIRALKGRVNAAAENGISYQTFLNWMEKKIEFFEAVKKAEEESQQKGKETAIMCIFEAMQKGQWQAGAWWLERKFKDEFARLDNVKHDYSDLSDAELKRALNQAYRELAGAGILSFGQGSKKAAESELGGELAGVSQAGTPHEN